MSHSVLGGTFCEILSTQNHVALGPSVLSYLWLWCSEMLLLVSIAVHMLAAFGSSQPPFSSFRLAFGMLV